MKIKNLDRWSEDDYYPKKQKAKKKLTKGPAIAILSAAIGVSHSFSVVATPPNKNNVILLIFTPSCKAIKECPIS